MVDNGQRDNPVKHIITRLTSAERCC